MINLQRLLSIILDLFIASMLATFAYLLRCFQEWQIIDWNWEYFRKDLLILLFFYFTHRLILKPIWQRIIYGKAEK